MLKENSSPLSGERLSRELHISRAGVWKQIQSLTKAGYEISTSPKGYTLHHNNDLLLPWEFPGKERLIHYYSCTDTTMKRARECADKNSPDRTLIIAETQTDGRGRLNRKWQSDTGGLYFTLILRPAIPPAYCFLYTCAASVALIETIACMFDLDASIKWPNDILIDNKKVAGILMEVHGTDRFMSYLMLGIGVNVNNRIKRNLTIARSLSALAGRHISRPAFLRAFLTLFYRLTDDPFDRNILSLYRKYCTTLRRYVTVIPFNGRAKRGRAIDITAHGDLLIEEDGGTVSHALFGECIPADKDR
jgi:BirA family biotin operon repressor/biotin-[acetyl-CoA-carboxylase] ligase